MTLPYALKREPPRRRLGWWQTHYRHTHCLVRRARWSRGRPALAAPHKAAMNASTWARPT